MRNLGPGSQPGLAVDAGGTAYIAWNGPEIPSTLRFCRLPRNGSACASGLTTTIATAGDSLSRPFVTVSGGTVRIVSYRYPVSGPLVAGSYLYTSTNGGVTFSEGVRVGSVPFVDAIQGPGDTVSGVTDALSSGMVFQNVPLGGGSSGDAVAVLSTDSPYRGTVGLVDAATPLAVFTDGSDAAKFRRYVGTGSLNDAANWTQAVGIGTAAYPKLAGGPRGLYLSSGLGFRTIVVRKYNGTGFSAPLSLGGGDPPNQHLTQDASGRLHLVVDRGDADGLHLIHWVSDQDGAWRSVTVASQNPGVEGAFNGPRVAIAPDHIGFAVWQASSTRDIRIVPLGPDVPLPRPTLALTGHAKHAARKVVVTASGRLVAPTGVLQANACKGKLRVTVEKGDASLDSKTVAVDGQCRFDVRMSIRARAVGGADKLKLVARFSGNGALASSTTTRSVKVRG